MAGSLAWPPTREDLERLYLVEHLSAAKIARIYELKYKTPKVAESVILYQLKKNGIPRRDSADHVRKVTSQTVDEWVTRYQAGESLKQIAGDAVSPVTVWLHLRKRGVRLRDKVEAQIEAVSKYERRPFSEDRLERSYLMGLRYGDLHVVRHGRAIRVRVSTTHPAMAELFESLFAPYSYVHRYPRRANLTGYEWTLECDLGLSFEFLLEKPSLTELESSSNQEFIAFLAGFFDAEGSIYLHRKFSSTAPELQIRNKDVALLEWIQHKLRKLRVESKMDFLKQDPSRFEPGTQGEIWGLRAWRFDSVTSFLRLVPLRHPERIAKAIIATSFTPPLSRFRNLGLIAQWDELLARIEDDRLRFIEQAHKAILQSDHSVH